jgi:hypothetical protein
VQPSPGEPSLPEAALVEDDCAEAHENFTLELRAFLQLLIRKGVLKPGEYTEALKKLRATAAAKPK